MIATVNKSIHGTRKVFIAEVLNVQYVICLGDNRNK